MTPPGRIVVIGCGAGDLAVISSVAAASALEVRVLDGGEGLVPALLAEQPDAVVLDVDQPGTTGYAMCAQLKAEPALAGVPVILITSLDGPEPRHRAYAAGCDDYLEKPFSRSELQHRFRSFVRLRRAWARRAD